MTSPQHSRRSEAAPLWATPRRPERETLGPQLARLAELLGTPFMPWQRLVADVGLEINPDTGQLAYQEVWFTVSRQSGKTSLSLPWRMHRAVAPVWGGPQRALYTAQTGGDAFRKMMEDELPLVEQSALGPLLRPAHGGRVRLDPRTAGWKFGNGSSIDLMASGEASGHGRTIDLGVIDEAFRDLDDRREQAILPATMTRPSSQILGYSTMGTESSVFLNRKVAAGRAAVREDVGTGIAYVEYAIPADADIDDPEVWWQHLPALGYTMTEDTIRHARQTMSDAEFRRAIANQQTVGQTRDIPQEMWDPVKDRDASPGDGFVFGLELDESGAWSVAAGIDGVGEVVASGHGSPVGWLSETPGRRKRTVLIDGSGPTGALYAELVEAKVKVDRLGRGDVADRCRRFMDMMADGRLKVRPTSAALETAVAAAQKRPVGDRWVWSRSTEVNMSPLMSLTLAATHVAKPKSTPNIRVIGGRSG